MASVPPIGVAVLAAGQSRRFGEADKLAAQFRGQPLGQRVCETLAPLPFAARWVIASDLQHPCSEGWREAGFELLLNEVADSGMGSSLALAAQQAANTGLTGLLVALADMPLVPESHFANLLERVNEHSLCASHNGCNRTPPAIFGSAHFPALQKASGDEGARKLIKRADFIECPAALLVDIDTPEALARLG